MPTAILQVELRHPPLRPQTVDARYERAFVVGRLCGRPIGHALLSVARGIVDPEALADHAAWWLASLDAAALDDRWTGTSVPGAEEIPPPSMAVAVCSRDRPEDLRRCLTALEHAWERGHEVVVVDNDRHSPGATAAVAKEFELVRCVRESTPGLSAARNRAVIETASDVLCFTDDDAVPEPGWVEALRQHFTDPMVWCATGLTLPLHLETEAQELFERHTSHGRGYRPLRFRGAEMNPLAVGPIGAGVNMAVRRSAFAELGLFDTALGAGSPARAGEDYDMFARILPAGFHIVYEPAAVGWHRHRLELDELEAAFYAYSAGVYAHLFRSLVFDRELGAVPYGKRWLLEDQLPSLWRGLLGESVELPVRHRLAEVRGLLASPWLYLKGRLRRPRPA
jgi:GT2 family glycosyltransferase